MDRTTESAEIIRGLAATLERIRAVSRRLATEQLTASPEPGDWSPNEILWHIRAAADVYGEQVNRILSEHEPRWRHISPRARMKKSRYDQALFADSLAAFEQQRNDLVALLEGIGPEAWKRFALVKVDHGPDEDRRLTLHQVAGGMAQHEAVHCAQMEAVAASLT